jgi:hypothetical protein
MPSVALETPAWTQASSVSTLTDHGPCCARARAWLIATARSHDFASTDGLTFAAPRWLNKRWTWGPAHRPIAWCEAIKSETIDCGIFGVFALEIFRAKGSEAYPGQMLRTYAEENTAHWHHRWASLPGASDSMGGHVVCHDICVVRVNGNQARVYDPTDGVWLDPEIYSGHGSRIAIRAELPVPLKWGPHTLVNGRWTERASRANESR